MIKGETEQLLMTIAHRIWTDTYGSGGTEADAQAAISRRVDEMQDGSSEDTPATDRARLIFAVQWVHAGCVTLTTSHKFAAALAASRAREPGLLDDVVLPAKAFRVEIPNGILQSEEHNRDYTQVNVCVLENGQGLFMLEGQGPVGREGTRVLSCLPCFFSPSSDSAPTIAELLADREDDEQHFIISQMAREQQTPTEMAIKERMVVLARRIVAGLLLTFAHTTHWRGVGPKESRSRGEPRGAPMHRVIFIGRPINVDARPAIARYLGARGKAAPPSVQTLVRGHHKRQVIGVGRSGRKVIWIEPYWRGDEDAPILARPYKIG